jgi:hypothetical protein
LAYPNPVQLYTPVVTYSLSTYALSQVMTVPINEIATVVVYSTQTLVGWHSPGEVITNVTSNYETSYAPPLCSYNATFYFAGYTNIVDQNNQPVPRNKLIFWCVSTNSPTNLVGIPPQPDLSIKETVPLQTIPGTNSCTIQWPLYGSDYQLQMANDLQSDIWTTNSLPPPVQNGPFLQVTIPTMNSRAFFRLLKTN